MKSIDNECINEICINKSRFICVLSPVNNKEEALMKIDYYKNKYSGATHYCTSYIIDNYSKCDDDGEPSGTAGVPMLNVLLNNNLNNVLAIVIRYFGGIKLGAGGLIRAYSRSVSEALNKVNIVDFVSGFYIKISFNYDSIKHFDYILNSYDIDKSFDENVIYSFYISEDDFINIENLISDNMIEKKEVFIPLKK